MYIFVLACLAKMHRNYCNLIFCDSFPSAVDPQSKGGGQHVRAHCRQWRTPHQSNCVFHGRTCGLWVRLCWNRYTPEGIAVMQGPNTRLSSRLVLIIPLPGKTKQSDVPAVSFPVVLHTLSLFADGEGLDAVQTWHLRHCVVSALF